MTHLSSGFGAAPGLFVLGAGNALVVGRLSSLALDAVAEGRQGEASAVNAGVSDLAYGLGVAILGAVFVGVAASGIVSGIEQHLGVSMAPGARQQVESRLENDLRTLTPAQQDVLLESQARGVRDAVSLAAASSFREGMDAVLEVALVGFGLSLAVLAASRIRT